ncbi:hypothetical protein L9F63_015350, partial [Diploptera punctata]
TMESGKSCIQSYSVKTILVGSKEQFSFLATITVSSANSRTVEVCKSETRLNPYPLAIASSDGSLRIVKRPVISSFSDYYSVDKQGSGRNIRNLPCVSRRTGETGVCMFAFTCMKANGTHLGTCIERFYFGSCCKLPEDEISTIPNAEDNNLYPIPTTTESKYQLTTFQTVHDNDNRVEIDDNQTIKPIKPIVLPTKKPSIPEKKPTANPTTIKSTTPKTTTTNAQTSETPYLKPDVTSPSTTSPKPTSKPTQTTQTTYQTKPTKLKPTTQKPTTLITATTKPIPPVIITTKSTTQATPSRTTTTTRKPVIEIKPPVTTTRRPTTQTKPVLTTTRKPTTTQTTYSVTQKITTIKPILQTSEQTTARQPIETTTRKLDIDTQTTDTATKKPTTQTSTLQTSTLKPVSLIVPPSTTTKKPIFQTRPTSTTTRKPISTTKRPETTSRAPVTRPKPSIITTKKPVTSSNTTKPKPTLVTTKKPVTSTTTRKPPTKKPTIKTTERPTETTTTAPASLITWTSAVVTQSLAKRRGTTSLTTTAYSPKIFKIIIATPAVKVYGLGHSSQSKNKAATTMTTTVDWILVPVTTHPPSTDTTQQPGTTTSTYPDTTPDVSTSRPETTLEPEVTSRPAGTNTTLDIDLNMTDFRQVCGRRLFPESRIVGGDKSSFGKWPWQIWSPILQMYAICL